MYKLLLCWRYLRTRYIALASITSVMLGVATMIVVNSVMAGFSREMQSRIHGILSDVVFESHSMEGFPDAQWHMDEIRRFAGADIAGMTPTVAVPAMMSFQVRGQWITRQVNLIGIDEATHDQVSDFARFLQHPENRKKIEFKLREGGYDTFDHEGGDQARERPQMKNAGWPHRRDWALLQESLRIQRNEVPRRVLAPGAAATREGNPQPNPLPEGEGESDSTAAPEPPTLAPRPSPLDPDSMELVAGQTPSEGRASDASGAQDPFANRGTPAPAVENVFDPAREQHTGLIGGIALYSYRTSEGDDRFLAVPGDDVRVTFPTTGTPPKAISDIFTMVDVYESKMSEYDASFAFIPLRKLQELRGMIHPVTGAGSVTAIQIRLKPGVDLDAFRDKLRAHFVPELYGIYTWRDKQGPLLAAVQMETAILNVLLFLIIAVAGFGILAIFYMIVVEKTRDIGILKSLGASGRGIQGIFLGYGLSLGVVGSGVGLVGGLLFVHYINEIADLLGKLTGRPVFDPSVYYFQRIPTIVQPLTLTWIVGGAVAIAVLSSILPARRAARLHPVEALRYE